MTLEWLSMTQTCCVFSFYSRRARKATRNVRWHSPPNRQILTNSSVLLFRCNILNTKHQIEAKTSYYGHSRLAGYQLPASRTIRPRNRPAKLRPKIHPIRLVAPWYCLLEFARNERNNSCSSIDLDDISIFEFLSG